MNKKIFPFFLRSAAIAALSFFALTACGTPSQSDFEKEMAEKIGKGMSSQKAIANLTKSGFSCAEYTEKTECTRLKQKVVPPVTCVEKVSFIKDANSLISDISIEKVACAGL